jgi:hypothetical protein
LHIATDRCQKEDERSIANRLAAAEKEAKEDSPSDEGLNKKDPTAPVCHFP